MFRFPMRHAPSIRHASTLPDSEQKKNIIGCTLGHLKALLSTMNQPSYRASQIYNFLYHQRGTDWSQADGLPSELRQSLATEWKIDWGGWKSRDLSKDGTAKFLFDFGGKGVVESNNSP